MARAYFTECPCYKCQDRQIGCHSKCDKYANWKRDSRETDETTQFSNSREFGLFSNKRKRSK